MQVWWKEEGPTSLEIRNVISVMRRDIWGEIVHRTKVKKATSGEWSWANATIVEDSDDGKVYSTLVVAKELVDVDCWYKLLLPYVPTC